MREWLSAPTVDVIQGIAVAVVLLAPSCASRNRTPVPSPGVDGYDEARLQLLVDAGSRHMPVGPCRSAMLLGVLDDDASGDRLEQLQAQASDGNVEAGCAEVIAAARIVRLGRLGTLDLAHELEAAPPVGRAVALRYALGTLPPSEAAALARQGMADRDVDVRIVAYRVAAALGESELVAALSDQRAETPTEEFWRCTALARLDASTQCPEPGAARTVIPVGDVEPPDRCARASAMVESGERRDALWFYLASAFRERVEPLDRLEATQRPASPCALAEAEEDEILSSKDAPLEDQAIVAAAALWRRHEPVGIVRERRVELRGIAQEDSLTYCAGPRDCAEGSDCFRPPGRAKRGICGGEGRGQQAPRTSVFVTIGSNACWSFLDCPAFYSCYHPDPYAPYGVCVY